MPLFDFRFLPNCCLSLEQQKRKCLHKLENNEANQVIRAYLASSFPDKSLTVKETPILSLDFETTGLNPIHDQVLSVGCVEINNGGIELATSYHQVIKTSGKLDKQNVVIHQITDSEKNQGIDLKSAIEQLLIRASGKVLLVHFAQIEKAFLQQACYALYGVKPPLLMIDTLAIIKRRFDLSDVGYDPSRLRLGNLRQHVNLPSYQAHNALNDAIATGELFLAELNQNHQGLQTPLANLTR